MANEQWKLIFGKHSNDFQTHDADLRSNQQHFTTVSTELAIYLYGIIDFEIGNVH